MKCFLLCLACGLAPMLGLAGDKITPPLTATQIVGALSKVLPTVTLPSATQYQELTGRYVKNGFLRWDTFYYFSNHTYIYTQSTDGSIEAICEMGRWMLKNGIVENVADAGHGVFSRDDRYLLVSVTGDTNTFLLGVTHAYSRLLARMPDVELRTFAMYSYQRVEKYDARNEDKVRNELLEKTADTGK